MGLGAFEYREFRFVIGEDLTEVFVLCHALGDCPLGVQGWHHKAFPKTFPVIDIMEEMFLGEEDPILWGLSAPKGG